MSFNHITNTIFDRLNEKEYVEGEDPRYYFSVLRDNPPNNWLEEEVDYVIDKMTRPEVIQTPHFFGLSALMDQFERNSAQSLINELPNVEKKQLEATAAGLFKALTESKGESVISPREFKSHWIVNLYIRKYALRHHHLAQLENHTSRAWEHYAVILEALESGAKPLRNMGSNFEICTLPECPEAMEVSTAELEGSGGEEPTTVLTVTIGDSLLAEDYEILEKTAPYIEWNMLPCTNQPHRVLTWKFTTSLGYCTTLRLPLALFSGNHVLVSLEKVTDCDHQLIFLIVGTHGRMLKTYSCKQITTLPRI